MVHIAAVQAALTPEEAALAQEIAKELSPAEMRAWFDELAALTVPECVERIRALLHGGAARPPRPPEARRDRAAIQ